MVVEASMRWTVGLVPSSSTVGPDLDNLLAGGSSLSSFLVLGLHSSHLDFWVGRSARHGFGERSLLAIPAEHARATPGSSSGFRLFWFPCSQVTWAAEAPQSATKGMSLALVESDADRSWVAFVKVLVAGIEFSEDWPFD